MSFERSFDLGAIFYPTLINEARHYGDCCCDLQIIKDGQEPKIETFEPGGNCISCGVFIEIKKCAYCGRIHEDKINERK